MMMIQMTLTMAMIQMTTTMAMIQMTPTMAMVMVMAMQVTVTVTMAMQVMAMQVQVMARKQKIRSSLSLHSLAPSLRRQRGLKTMSRKPSRTKGRPKTTITICGTRSKPLPTRKKRKSRKLN